ncbi:Pyridoxamine 5'-phosphate oxidase [Streptomyces sp. Ncost-T10-10d]|nr:Pyridoxamine 5'-phosphate oxidase [Streptomyces sp. Ncost-T10-10d]
MLLDEVAHAAWGMAGTQGRAVRSGEEADGHTGKGGGQDVPFRRSVGRVVMGDRIAVLRPVEAWHGRGCGSGGVEPAERLFDGQQPSGVGGARLAGADGIREERPNGVAQQPHGFEALLVGRPGFAGRRIAEQGWQFASDAGGVKGRDLMERPCAALTFSWSPPARQVRVPGPVVTESAEQSAADFLARGAGARAESLPGRQSSPLGDLAERDAAVRESPARLEREPDLVPRGWTLHTVRFRRGWSSGRATSNAGTHGSTMGARAVVALKSGFGRSMLR